MWCERGRGSGRLLSRLVVCQGKGMGGWGRRTQLDYIVYGWNVPAEPLEVLFEAEKTARDGFVEVIGL